MFDLERNCLSTCCSAPILVLANNDAPNGPACINLDMAISDSWEGWPKAEMDADYGDMHTCNLSTDTVQQNHYRMDSAGPSGKPLLLQAIFRDCQLSLGTHSALQEGHVNTLISTKSSCPASLKSAWKESFSSSPNPHPLTLDSTRCINIIHAGSTRFSAQGSIMTSGSRQAMAFIRERALQADPEEEAYEEAPAKRQCSAYVRAADLPREMFQRGHPLPVRLPSPQQLGCLTWLLLY